MTIANKGGIMEFFILSQARSGSSLLAEMLNSHSKIECAGEIFNPTNLEKTWGRLGKPIADKWPFINVWVHKNRCTKENFGFKQIINHAKNPMLFVNTMYSKGFQIMDLRRDNLIEKAFSASIAYTTGSWYVNAENKRVKDPIFIDPELLFFRLAHSESQDQLQEQLVAGKNVIKINYEQELINAERQGRFSTRICQELGLNEERLTGICIKTDERPLSERIQNYDDLMKKIADSKYAKFL